MSQYAIETFQLTKQYPDGTLAVDQLDIKIAAGTIYALLGPNGAGKTTTFSMLTTLITPTSGRAAIGGIDIAKDKEGVRRKIGVTFQEVVLDKELKGREVLDYHGQLYGLSRAARRERIAALLKLIELEDSEDRLVKHYSGGMKRRLELARGLMTDPEVLFLDEPTNGLDPQNRARIWEYLRHLRDEKGITIVLTTHYMDEADWLADRVGIIDRGKLIVEGEAATLVKSLGADVIRISGQGESAPLVDRIKAFPFVREVVAADGIVQIGVDQGNRRLVDIVQAAGDYSFIIEDVAIAKPSLGDVFLKYTGYALRKE